MEAIKDREPQRLLLWLFVQIYEPEISRRQKGPWEKLVGWGPLGGERSFVDGQTHKGSDCLHSGQGAKIQPALKSTWEDL